MPTPPSDKGVRPAPPVLASTLVDLESDDSKSGKAAEPFQTGIARLDANLPQSLWTGGKVIGIASDKGDSMLAEHLIATHLSRLTAPVSWDTCSKASTFVIAPPNTPVASNINDVLQTRLITRLETVRIQLLDTVQIMPYFDIVGLSESFSEVTSRLLDMHNMTDDEPSHRKRHILLIDGLCPALDSTQRRSGLVQANALAASFLRSVTNLSRSHSHILIVVNLGATWDSRAVRELTSAFSGVGKWFSGVSPGGLLQTTLLAGIDTVILLHDMVDAGLRDGDLIVEVVKDRTDACLGHWTVWPRSG